MSETDLPNLSTPELNAARAMAASIHGDRVAVLELGGRVWCLAVPRQGFRAMWQRFKAMQASPDPTTKADAGVQLARAMLVPVDAPPTDAAKKALRADFDAMGDEAPALLDILGETAEALALGPLPIRVASPGSSSSPGGATPTSPQTP